MTCPLPLVDTLQHKFATEQNWTAMAAANNDSYMYSTSDATNKKILRHLEYNKILLRLSLLLEWFPYRTHRRAKK
jgi:hypothetical protein